jgi:hypothetical protein
MDTPMIPRNCPGAKIHSHNGLGRKRVVAESSGYAVPAICLTLLHQVKKMKRRTTRDVSQSGNERFPANLTVPTRVQGPTLQRNTVGGVVLGRKGSVDSRNPLQRHQNLIQDLPSVQELPLPQHCTNA